jgi:HAD superfamily hydrolase (TIGR01549 family)
MWLCEQTSESAGASDPYAVRRKYSRSVIHRTMPPAVWICDVNGVLVDSIVVTKQAFRATAGRYRLRMNDADFRMIKGCTLIDAYRMIDGAGDAVVRRAYHLGYVREHADQVRAFAMVGETLAIARAAGIRIGAATSHGETAEASLVASGLYRYIDCLVTQDEVRRPKPSPDSLLRIMRLLRPDADTHDVEVLHVGDTVEDMLAGKAAGVCTVGATYGMSRESEIRAAEPDYVIHSFHDMKSWLMDLDLSLGPLAIPGSTADVSPIAPTSFTVPTQ